MAEEEGDEMIGGDGEIINPDDIVEIYEIDGDECEYLFPSPPPEI